MSIFCCLTTSAFSSINYLPITNMMSPNNRFLHNPSFKRKQMGSLSFFSSAFGSQSLISSGASENGSASHMTELGSLQPRQLKHTIRVLVPRPKRSHNTSKKEKPMEVLVIYGIEIQKGEPVRLDVYVSKPIGNEVGPVLGEFAGSLVNLGIVRDQRNLRKGRFKLGITGLVKDIGADDCEKLVVTLIPQTGDVIVAGIRIEYHISG